MGLFGNNEKQIKIELSQEMAHSCNDTNKDIFEVMEDFERNIESKAHLSEEYIDLIEKIIPKLEPNEEKALTDFAERLIEFQKDYHERYDSIIALSNKQTERTKIAISKYERFSNE